ncbi:BlaI/MecI/CopY family transcriptional regulator [Pontibacter sp. G13]|uniref:BlaI/MecI/CopY family transcriptional regulator n=1 Tax=Pontibacter sp. G13 TaxID=3074898 RepID=UPI00288B63B9|nr:BlaI/MecI/CopY family transcriptional regulator [Pontibacter sp. G13]WNJ20810.1 BlaI/MecI/CopY family transcriptional regulator [Pontibacter sp. G13]
MAKSKPTDGELAILRILWKNGPSTVRTVNDRLNDQRPVGYTTTLKIMQIMFDKGLLSRTKDGKTHVYEAMITEEETQSAMVGSLLDKVFQGSAMKLVMRALGQKQSSPEELAQIRAFLDELEDQAPNEETS